MRKRIEKESLSVISFWHSLPSPPEKKYFFSIVNWQICVYKKILRKFNLVLFLWGIIMQYQMVPCKIALKTKLTKGIFFSFRVERFFSFSFQSYILKRKVCLYFFLWAKVKEFFLLTFLFLFQKFQVRSFEISFFHS